MKKNIFNIALASSLVVLASCEPDFDEPIEDIVVTSGDADFTKYVALGNSLTSGFTDNALFVSGQENSYPNMLANQMAMAGGGAFVQPLMPDDIGGFTNLGVAGRLNLVINPETGALAPVPTPAQSPLTMVTGGVNNMGVPGAKSYHLLANGYGNPAGIAAGLANPYFVRFASSPTTSVLADAAAQAPTFFSLWIGNNDVLSYATGGGVGVNQMAANNVDPTTYGGADISHPMVVAGAIQQILETLTNTVGAKGVIANIPSITDIPYFTTVPTQPFSVNNVGADNIAMLNGFYTPINAALDMIGASDRKIVFSADAANGAVIIDETLPNVTPQLVAALVQIGVPQPQAMLLGSIYGQTRQSNSNDLMVFTSQTILGKLNMERVAELMAMGLSQAEAGQLSLDGLTNPLADKWVLTASEKNAVIAATDAYNAAIAQLAAQYDLAFVDAHKAMKDLSSDSGITYFGNTYTTTFVSGGAFSLDGVHLTGRGYAVVANYFIEAINHKFGSTLRTVNPNNFPGVKIP
ncbi:SGNH/GDSL hydrolase family protein [Moheibacter stercoris]|uniref:GDSL-like Lipase/Acylhydrolase n=1 Tax=Moheibacter stercoris TaxID=1628251 RepID=A0ABV2LZR2_9FLAO